MYLIFASSQPADYTFVLVYAEFFIPDLSSVLDTDHILPVGCKDEKKKSSYPQVSVQLPPTSQPLIKTKITNNNNNNNNNKNQEIGKKVKKGNKQGIGRRSQNHLYDWVN